MYHVLTEISLLLPKIHQKTQSILWLEGTVQSYVTKHTKIKGNTENVTVERNGLVICHF